MEDGTCNKKVTVEGRDGDAVETNLDTIDVGVSEGNKDEDKVMVIDGDSLKGVSSTVLSWLGS